MFVSKLKQCWRDFIILMMNLTNNISQLYIYIIVFFMLAIFFKCFFLPKSSLLLWCKFTCLNRNTETLLLSFCKQSTCDANTPTQLYSALPLLPIFAIPGVAISSYAKYCYRRLQKAALMGAKKVVSSSLNSFLAVYFCQCFTK